MSIKIEDGTLKISAGYSLKVGLPNYSSQDAHSGISLEFPVEGEEAAILDAAGKLYDNLSQACKLAAMATLGVDAEVDEDGVLQPKLAAPAAAPAPAPAAPRAPQGGGGYQQPRQQQGGGFAPKADLSGAPTFVADLGDGHGTCTWIDLRPTKAAGLFKPTAADFRDANNPKHQVWATDKQGNIKATVAQGLQAAGINVNAAEPQPAPF